VKEVLDYLLIILNVLAWPVAAVVAAHIVANAVKR
jgi:hypothetical protein